MGDFKLSIIKIINNDILTVEESIDSIISQNSDFEKNVQLVLLDLGSSDGSYEVAEKVKYKYPNNVKLIQTKDEHIGDGKYYNMALKEADGDFIHFFDNYSELSANAFSEAKNI